jgi:hypothetical protein
MIFTNPSRVYIENNITDVVYATEWVNEFPVISALQVTASYSLTLLCSLSICLSACLAVSLSLCLSVSLSLYPSIHHSLVLSQYISHTHLSNTPFHPFCILSLLLLFSFHLQYNRSNKVGHGRSMPICLPQVYQISPILLSFIFSLSILASLLAS